MSSPVPQNQPFSHYQNEIYAAGLDDRLPAFTTDLDTLSEAAREQLSTRAYGYVAGGAGTADTMRANRAAFGRWRIVPRMLTDVGQRRHARTVLGTRIPAPLLLAPIGVLSIMHPDGELAVARAAAEVGLPMVASTASSYTMEEIAAAGRDVDDASTRWFQLYWPAEREVTRSMLRRARHAGYSALVVTLDTRLLAWRPYDLDQAYLPFLHRTGLANYLADPAFRAGLEHTPEEDPSAAVLHWIRMFADPTQTWQDLEFLRDHWDGPIVVKGIQHPDDARRAVDAGMDGVVVSNHGGRQVDGALAAVDALPGIVNAVGEEAAVLFDSGVRSGADIVKALALGAQAVLLGRPYAYGLGLAGQEGVRHALRSALADYDLTLALSGYAGPDQLRPDALVRD